jgi:hypothetical protein
MKVIVDRFEGDYAVVELPDQTMADLPKRLIPGAKEGDVIEIHIDEAARKEREARIGKLTGELFE